MFQGKTSFTNLLCFIIIRHEEKTRRQIFLCHYRKYSNGDLQEFSMDKKPLPKDKNIYETECPILYAMNLIGQKWKLPILWYLADAENQTLRYRELERKVVGITATMLTKCLRELEEDGFIKRTQYNTIPPTVEYSLADRGKTLIPALESVYQWADQQMNNE